MLSAFVNDNHTDWDEQLPYVMMAYRSSIHETTGFTPNSLMLGREVSTPLDILYEMPSPIQAIPQSRWVWVSSGTPTKCSQCCKGESKSGNGKTEAIP